MADGWHLNPMRNLISRQERSTYLLTNSSFSAYNNLVRRSPELLDTITMDSSDSDEGQEVNNQTTFRIRFTIGNSNREGNRNQEQTIRGDSNSSSDYRGRECLSDSRGEQNVEHCDHTSFIGQNETNECKHQIGGQSKQEEDQQHLLRNNLRPAQQRINKSYRFVEPQNHKSALFVNLGGITGNQGDQSSDNANNINRDHINSNCSINSSSDCNKKEKNIFKRSDRQLFISPDLHAVAAAAAESLSISTSTSPSSAASSIDYPCSPQVVTVPGSDDTISVFELIEPENDEDEHDRDLIYDDEERGHGTDIAIEAKPDSSSPASNMSHSCNFMNWVSATKRRSSSTTPSIQTNKPSSASSETFKDLTNSTTVEDDVAPVAGVARRASSSDGLNQAGATLDASGNNLLASAVRSASRNHLAISDSVETVCERDQTQTNKFAPCVSAQGAIMQPLDIQIDSPPLDEVDIGPSPLSVTNYPASLDAILQIDTDNLQLAEEECRRLEEQAQYWEQRVEEMERKQFADDVPRTLVENIIKHRRELRDLDFKLYQYQLDSEESDRQSCEEKLSQALTLYENDCVTRDGSTSPSEKNFKHQESDRMSFADAQMCLNSSPSDLQHQVLRPHHERFITDFNDLSGTGSGSSELGGRASKFGSQIRPGQENTAHILDAVPPSGSLQHRQYLSKASSGTDSSEYSQLPSFNQHKHHIVHQRHQNTSDSFMDEQVRHHRQHQRQRHQNHQIYQQQLDHHRNQHHRVSRVSHRQESQQQHHRQSYIQLDACSVAVEDEKLRPPTQSHSRNRLCSSPIRPNHFKSEFKPPKHVIAQDSSSTASSASPQ